MRSDRVQHGLEVAELRARVARLLDDRRAWEAEQEALRTQLEESRLQAEESRLQAERSEAERKALEEETRVLYRRISELTRQLADATGKDRQQKLALEMRVLKQRLSDVNRELFGAHSERRGRREGEEEEAAAPKPAPKPRTGHGPTPQERLPFEAVDHPLAEAETRCPKCEGEVRRIEGQDDECEEIEVVERTFKRLRHRYAKGRCATCGHIVTALRPRRLVPGGRYSENFAVAVAVDKYDLHLPLARQARQMEHQGLEVTRQTLWDQLRAMHVLLGPSLAALKAAILSSPLLFADETTWRLMEKGGTKRWWAWSLSTTEAVFYELLPSRGTEAAKTLLQDYAGTVMADGYSVYQKLEKALERAGGRQTRMGPDGKVEVEVLPNFTLASCWAHARRYFWKAEKGGTVEAGRALDLIAGFYAIEVRAEEMAGGDEERLLAVRAELRATLSRPLVEKLDAWRRQQKALPKSHFGEGLTYLDNQWPRLVRFLSDPRIPIDNGQAERAMRGPVLGRKNHYGSRSIEGTEVAALFYSLVETCKLIGLDPTTYLRTAVRRALDVPGAATLPMDLARELREVQARVPPQP
jgi:transposase